MLALILAGGEGRRLGMGEKPLVTIAGKPMISYVTCAFLALGCETVVVLSEKTPYLRNYCHAQGIPFFRSSGVGYIEDIVETVQFLEEEKPLFTCVSDIPCVTPEILASVLHRYEGSGKDACSTWVPRSLVDLTGCRSSYTETVEGVQACPAGINILHGARIAEVQEEERVLLREKRLAFNVNTRRDLDIVRSFFSETKQAPER